METINFVETWKPVPGYDGRYEVSDWGRVRSLNPTGHQPSVIYLRPKVGRGGYHVVRLYKDKVWREFGIHRLVLIAFVGLDADRREANHKDGDKANNHLSNLEWLTRRENHMHALKLGLKLHPRQYRKRNGKPEPRGVDHPTAKLSEEQVRDIKYMLRMGIGPTRIASALGINRTTINAIKFGVTWTHID